MSSHASEMLRRTDELHRLFSPAPLDLDEKPKKVDLLSTRRTSTSAGGGSSCAAGAPPTPKGLSGALASKVRKPTARSSLHVTKGCKLAQLIETGCISLVRSSYFEDCLLHNRPFAMRQLIPNSFTWRGTEAVGNWWKHGKCFLCIVSYPWLSRDHPDPHQVHLKKLVRIFEEYKRIWNVHELAVIIDYCSLWQRGPRGDTRTSEQKEQFKLGFEELSIAYAHKSVTAIKLTAVPETEKRQYDDRGWTLMESILMDSKGGDWNRWTFGELDAESAQWPDSVVFFMQARPSKLRPPLTPQAFGRELEERGARLRARDLQLFSRESDREEVPRRYEEFFCQLLISTKLVYDSAGWSDEELADFAEVLGKCSRLEHLQLNNNRITIAGASMLAKLIPHLEGLKYLSLAGNPLCQEIQATELLKLVWTREKRPAKGLVLAV